PKSMDYSHELRNYAQVCREGLEFYGTVGAENCSIEEIAALLIVLDSRFDQHGFKIGLGKPLGLGSVSSRIRRIWVRKPGDYNWDPFDVKEDEKIPLLPPCLQDAQRQIKLLTKAHHAVFSLQHVAGELKYPEPGNLYWKAYKDLNR
ncbi:MAG TPA: hypothetical protein P5196_12210, partial [Syntrophales bacterium]|nr:hypothetical protein [Syntrophales bacterium]